MLALLITPWDTTSTEQLKDATVASTGKSSLLYKLSLASTIVSAVVKEAGEVLVKRSADDQSMTERVAVVVVCQFCISIRFRLRFAS